MNTRNPPEEQLAALEKKQDQIKARIAKKKAQIRTQSRKQDTRRKIIAGAGSGKGVSVIMPNLFRWPTIRL